MNTISVGQALLILMDKYRDDKEKFSSLKQLYLLGANTKENRKKIEDYLKDDILKNYHVSTSPSVIDKDPSRRYFETHLAYNSLFSTLDSIDYDNLKEYYQAAYKQTREVVKNKEEMKIIDAVLSGKDTRNLKLNQREYRDAIKTIQNGSQYANFSPEQKAKITLLISCAYLGIINASYDYLPIPIYGKGIYHEVNKGRDRKKNSHSLPSHNVGILKGYMPVPHDDIGFSDEASSHLRPADQFEIVNMNACWVNDNFNHLVHPFSSAISGTMLCQLRLFKYINEKKVSVFNTHDTFSNFIKGFTTAMLYNGGGHTFHEFLTPLSVKDVKKGFNFIDDFDDINELNLLLKDNEAAFDQALENTIAYNNRILQRGKLHAQITGSTPVEAKNKALSNFKITRALNLLSEQVTTQKEHYENQLWLKNSSKNKLLQMGVDYVIKHMDNGNLSEAQIAINELKQKFEEKFGKKNLGQKSKSFNLITSVERELAHIQHEFKYDTAKLKNKTVLEELVDLPTLGRDLNEAEDELTVRARSHLKSMKDRLSLDRNNKAIDKAYIEYSTPRDKSKENQEQYEQRIKAAADILVKKLNIKQDNINNDKERNQQIMIKMAERLEIYRQSLFTRGKGTLAERLDKAWECYNDNTRTYEDRLIAQGFMIFVLDIRDENILEDLNKTLKKLMIERELVKDENPDFIPGKSPIVMNEKAKFNLKQTEMSTQNEKTGETDNEELEELIQKKDLLDVNPAAKLKDKGQLKDTSGRVNGKKTEFFNLEERDMLRVVIRNGLLYDTAGKVFDTQESLSHDKERFAAFTLNVNGELSVFQQISHDDTGIAHSSMTSGVPVFSAGEIEVKNGNLISITDHSGHYRPSLYNINKTLDYFKKQGLDISDVKVYTFTSSKAIESKLKIDVEQSKEYRHFSVINAKDLCNSYTAHLSKVVKDIQHELADYHKPSFKKYLYIVKDFFLGSTLTKERRAIAKQLAEDLVSLSDEISSANTLDSLKAVNDKINKLLVTSDEKNKELSQKSEKNISYLTQRITFFGTKLREVTDRIESAIKIKDENKSELSEENILSSNEQLKGIGRK